MRDQTAQAGVDPNARVHETACVDEGCTVGAHTKIWHFTHIMPGAEVGDRVNIGQNVVVSPDVRIGDGSKIQNNVSLYTGVVLEDNVFCGPSMVFTNITTPRCEFPRRDTYEDTLIRYGASLGANCTIVCGHTVGRFALIGAGAVVTRDVLDYSLMTGVPARRIGWACRCGLVLPPIDADGNTACSCGNEYAVSNDAQDAALHPVNENDPLDAHA